MRAHHVDTNDEEPRDRWFRRAMMAFPARWREVYGAEFFDVSRSLSGTPTDRRPPIRELADIVAGGLLVRHRDRPPWIDRVRYESLGRPIPQRWHLWRRDRINQPITLSPLATVWVLLVGSTGDVNPLFLTLFVSAIVLSLALRRRRIDSARRRFEQQIGYRIFAGERPPPGPLGRPTLRPWTPSTRLPVRPVATVVGCWSVAAGAALLGGASLPNVATRQIFGVSYAPDPASPLRAIEVLGIAVGAIVVAGVVATAVHLWLSRRLAGVAPTTIPSVSSRSGHTLSAMSALLGVFSVGLGLSGILPDLASAGFGGGFVVAGAALLTLARSEAVRWHGDRPLTFGDLLRGEVEAPAGYRSLSA